MYSFVDRPVSCLSQGSRFALWAMRNWTKAQSARVCPPKLLAASFQGMGTSKALNPFHAAMSILNRHARETISIAPVNHGRIGEHEAILLGLWRDSLDPSTRPRRDATLDLLVADRADIVAIAIEQAAMALAHAELAPDGLARDDTEEESL